MGWEHFVPYLMDKKMLINMGLVQEHFKKNKYISIIEQSQTKLIIKYFNKLKKPCFGTIFDSFSQLWEQKKIF